MTEPRLPELEPDPRLRTRSVERAVAVVLVAVAVLGIVGFSVASRVRVDVTVEAPGRLLAPGADHPDRWRAELWVPRDRADAVSEGDEIHFAVPALALTGPRGPDGIVERIHRNAPRLDPSGVEAVPVDAWLVPESVPEDVRPRLEPGFTLQGRIVVGRSRLLENVVDRVRSGG